MPVVGAKLASSARNANAGDARRSGRTRTRWNERERKRTPEYSLQWGAAFSVVIFYYYAMHGCMPGLEAEPRAMPHTERYAVSPRRALRAAMPAMALTHTE